MVASITQHKDALEYKTDLVYRGKTVSIVLSNAALTAESPPSDCFNSELPNVFGYERHFHTFDASDGSYSTDSKEVTLPELTYTITATEGSLQWQSAFVSADNRILAIVNESAPVTLLPGQSYTYKIALKEARI